MLNIQVENRERFSLHNILTDFTGLVKNNFSNILR